MKKPKEEKEPKKKVEIIGEDFTNNLADQFKEEDSDIVFDMEGCNDVTVGVKKIFYSKLPNLDRIIAFKEGTKIFGLPLCKLFEVYGAESSGKTSLLNYLGCCVIQLGGIAMFIDFELKFDPRWFVHTAKFMGLTVEDLKRFVYRKPKHFEWFIDWLLRTLKTIIISKDRARKELSELENKKKKPDDYEKIKSRLLKIINMPNIIMVDSIANMFTKIEVQMADGKLNDDEKKKAKDQVAELSRGFSRKLKMIRRQLPMSDTLLIFTNQERDIIGSKFRLMTTPGGKAVKSNCDGRIHIWHGDKLKRTRAGIQQPFGSMHGIKITKNQMGPIPFQTTELMLLYDRGYYSFYSVLETCAEVGLIKKSGSQYEIHIGGKIGDLKFEQSEMEEIEKQYPKLENALHNLYQKWMVKQ